MDIALLREVNEQIVEPIACGFLGGITVL